MTAKQVRKQVAAKLQRCHKGIKKAVEYAIDQYMETIGFGDAEEDAKAEATAAPGAHAITCTVGLGLGCANRCILLNLRCVVRGVGARLISWCGGAKQWVCTSSLGNC